MCKPFNLAKEIELEEAVCIAKKLLLLIYRDGLFSELVTLNNIKNFMF